MILTQYFSDFLHKSICCWYLFCYLLYILTPVIKISRYWDRKAFANSVDPDQMLQNEASDQNPLFAIYEGCSK